MSVNPTSSTGGATRRWLAFASCAAIWGSTFLFIRIGNDALPPVWAVALRMAIAAPLLALIALALRHEWPGRDGWRDGAIYGLLTFGVNLPLLYWGELVVPSGLAAVLYATIPLTSALISAALGVERLRAGHLLGAGIAIAGVALIFASQLGGGSPGLPALAIFAGATVSALAAVLLHRGPSRSPFVTNAIACGAALPLTLATSAVVGERWFLPRDPASVGSLLYLAVVGSIGAFVIFTWLIQHWPVTRASFISVLVPVVAIFLGAIFRGERLVPTQFAGSALVLTGLLIGLRSAPRPQAR